MTEAAHNLGPSQITSRAWAGVTMHSIDLRRACLGQVWHSISSEKPLLSVVVDEAGGHCEARLEIGSSCEAIRTGKNGAAGHISLIPAGHRIWGYSDGIARVTEARIELDPDRLREVSQGEFENSRLGYPRLMFVDLKIQTLARLLVGECRNTTCSSMFGDQIMVAILARLSAMESRNSEEGRMVGLPPRKLAAVQAYIYAYLAENIRLIDLAELTGLSQSQFGRAFKASTGASPHQWHMDARIESAKGLLRDRRHSLAELALVTGFSEQSHFTRVFKDKTGMPPGVWQRLATS